MNSDNYGSFVKIFFLFTLLKKFYFIEVTIFHYLLLYESNAPILVKLTTGYP